MAGQDESIDWNAMVPGLGVRLADIARIEIYKRDELTTDLICWDIWLSDGTMRLIHEDVAGYAQIEAMLSRLPGFHTDWRNDVVLPAFEEARATAFVARP